LSITFNEEAMINAKGMKYIKRQSTNKSKSISSIQRLLTILGFIFIIGTINVGCDSEPEQIEIDEDEYYVMYEIKGSHYQMGHELDVSINADKNQQMDFVTGLYWDVVIGPVQKGFKASLNANAKYDTYGRLTLYTNVYVSKNGSPFALKQVNGSDTPRDFVEIDYTIDY